MSKPVDLGKTLYETKDAKENSELVEEIKNRWINFKNETKKMSEEETTYEILDFDKGIQ